MAKRIWTKERCIEAAQEYKTQVDFKKMCGGAYSAAQKFGILKELHKFWQKKSKPRNYWTIDNCIKYAKTCSNRSELLKKYGRAYKVLSDSNLLDRIFPINEKNSKAKIHCVYAIVFPFTKSIYIGRTLMRRKNERLKEHFCVKTDTIYKYYENNPVNFEYIILEDKLSCIESINKEDEYCKIYSHNGFNVLNKAKTGERSGSIGALGFGKITKKYCYEIAKTCKTRHEFKIKNPSAYEKANKRGWSCEYTWFEEIHKPKGYWNNYDNCYEEFKKCNESLEILKKKNSMCYKCAVQNGFTKTWHKKRIAPNKKWTLETLSKIVKKYSSPTELQKNEGGAYNALRKMGLLYKFYKKQNDKPFGYWNVFENVEKEAKKYKSRWDFGKNNGSAYDSARRNGWMDILFK